MYCSILIYFQVLHIEMKGISQPVWFGRLAGPECRPRFMSFSLQGLRQPNVSDTYTVLHLLMLSISIELLYLTALLHFHSAL